MSLTLAKEKANFTSAMQSASDNFNIERGAEGSETLSKRIPLSSSLSLQSTGRARLEALIKVFNSDDKVLMIISADPDAIASAVALKRILWRKVSQVTIASINQVKRADNVQLIEKLKLKLEDFNSLNRENYSRFLMVDSQPMHSPLTDNISFDIIIDHHPNTSLSPLVRPPTYAEIRPDLGATATMMVTYLKAAKIKPNFRLGTALFYAIKTDTKNFVRQGQLEDMKAFRWLYPFISAQLLSEIEKAPINRSSFEHVLVGLKSAVFSKNSAKTFLAHTDHPDTLVILADFLMQIKGMNRSVAAGIYKNKLVIILRSGGFKQNVGKLAEKAFSKFGSAGGHKSMARAEIALDNLDPKIKDKPKAIERFIQKQLSGHES